VKKLIPLLIISCLALSVEYLLEKKDTSTKSCKSKYTINVSEALNDDESKGINDEQGTD